MDFRRPVPEHFPETVAFNVTRIRTTFRDVETEETCAPRLGTGFWLKTTEGKYLLVTNRHMLDPQLGFSDPEDWALHSVEVELRCVTGEVADMTQTEFLAVDYLSQCLFVPIVPTGKAPDCAFLADPEFIGQEPHHAHQGFASFNEIALATEDHLKADLKMMDPVAFIGFPGPSDAPWYDHFNQIPIARMATVASFYIYSNAMIRTADVSLVSGYSFGGSSGSPVISYPKGFQDGNHSGGWLRRIFGGITRSPEPIFRPGRLVGIMSGHYPDHEQTETPKMYQHTGLSHFTRSSAILALIDEARSKGFKNTP